MAFSGITGAARRVISAGGCGKFVKVTAGLMSSKVAAVSTVRNFHTTLGNLDIFTVQDEDDFKQKVISSSKPVVVEFHATWCGPCKQLMPRLETIIGSLPNEPVDLAKVDIDELPEIAMEYGVGAVPSVLLLNKGKVLDKFIGLQDEDKIKKFVSGVLK